MDISSMGSTNPYTALPLGDRPAREIADKTDEATQAFEAMFVTEIFKIMRKSTPVSQKDFGQKMFSEMFDEQIAKQIAQAGLGLQDILQDQLGKKTAQEAGSNVDRPNLSSDVVDDAVERKAL
jgi:Rod binding domain-containing protein